jgi:hypothetical protein
VDTRSTRRDSRPNQPRRRNEWRRAEELQEGSEESWELRVWMSLQPRCPAPSLAVSLVCESVEVGSDEAPESTRSDEGNRHQTNGTACTRDDRTTVGQSVARASPAALVRSLEATNLLQRAGRPTRVESHQRGTNRVARRARSDEPVTGVCRLTRAVPPCVSVVLVRRLASPRSSSFRLGCSWPV